MEIGRARSNIESMISRLSRLLILFAAAGVAYAGPVAACVCFAEPMEEMPCCPDDARQQDHSNCAQPDSAVNAACDPVPADLLSAAGTQDLSPPVAISAALPPWSVRGPPASSSATSPPPHDSPPIYLITLRLRI